MRDHRQDQVQFRLDLKQLMVMKGDVMNIALRIAFFGAALLAYGFASFPAHAVVADPGWVPGGLCHASPGEPAVSDCLVGLRPTATGLQPFSIQTISELDAEGTPEPAIAFSFTLPTVPPTLTIAPTAVTLQDTTDDPFSPDQLANTRVVIFTEPGNPSEVSDVIIRHDHPFSVGAKTFVRIIVGMWSDPGSGVGGAPDLFDTVVKRYAQDPNLFPGLGGLTVIPETGRLQDLSPFLFPDGAGNTQVLAQSDVEAVPEPQAWMLLAAGLMIGAWQVRRRAV
jgi:hypothetical protein